MENGVRRQKYNKFLKIGLRVQATKVLTFLMLKFCQLWLLNPNPTINTILIL